ncbi:diguanylate cyclase (GGDEF) domain-containing protein [Fibrobacter sp. UWB15]|jgi:diguanylate cyclase (GGDEF)-like protein|uniref:putative bifunctional diguanylate cyclase/phosphodiesterase n=1 Tax=unclassified Fibrobacter TaxID=2634177 RepID=UPI0009152455|nr:MULTISPECIES: GGDEF domain-containing phosphodiesterase [unclassified Fibrobacter]PWJ64481.1 diguanylate cyclase (GGDEF)-like protein [Fibrobacter sp. UWB6]SHG14748.1 diguanylate cyclase (GGDEF) domain-containing protein [Fibrobacter sp. UWB8]SMG32031.1 diguanylate cyclase (GGDEF) domain-containing protein [Fibrobacter sp. UWB15]
MDIPLYNDIYLDFRSKLLGPVFSTDEIFALMSRHLPLLAQSTHIGLVHCSFYAPVSQFAPNGISGDFTAYHDKKNLPTIPATPDFSETMTTGEQGSFTFQAHPIEGHSFTEQERKFVQLLSWDFFILTGRARLMGNTRKVAISDGMTGAYNQAGIFAFTQQFIRENLKDYTAFFINLKNFKYINKSMGNQMGDLALRTFVKQILLFLDKTELIARLGGDNFFVLTKKNRQKEFIDKFKITELNLSQGPKPVDVRIQTRIGVYPIEENVIVGDALNNASTAMMAARVIKNRDVVFFTKEMQIQSIHQREISSEFHNALRNRELVVFYQPKIDLADKHINGAEALARWVRHKTIVPPMDFIPVLEREGSICELDFYVFETACNDIHEWIKAGIEPVRISSNFSKLHLRNEDFADRILGILHKYELDGKYIEVELTEVSDFDDTVAMKKFIDIMRQNDIGVAIDDFGTGYSTLNVLKDYNISVVKIDKSLLNNIGKANSHDEVILRNVVKMARELSKDVIAEGVESQEQADYLKGINCRSAQGFLFDKPLVRDDFQKRLTGEVVY